MTTLKKNPNQNSSDFKTEINYDLEYDEMQLDLTLDYLKFEERQKRNRRILNLVIKWGGWLIALILYVYCR